MNRSSLKRSHHHLKRLVETVVADEFNLQARGLSFFVDELDVFGNPPERLKVWATLHFLPLGSPFCCVEPCCHVPLYGERLDRLNDALRRSMSIRHPVSVEFTVNSNATRAGVEFDDVFSGRCPTTNLSNIDARDALGRTALMRAAIRGHAHLVEELLAGGADPSAVDNRGRGIVEQARTNTWIVTICEEALAKRKGRSV
jgi:ankyrin repeat protein